MFPLRNSRVVGEVAEYLSNLAASCQLSGLYRQMRHNQVDQMFWVAKIREAVRNLCVFLTTEAFYLFVLPQASGGGGHLRVSIVNFAVDMAVGNCCSGSDLRVDFCAVGLVIVILVHMLHVFHCATS
jgi:hypothetical protein